MGRSRQEKYFVCQSLQRTVSARRELLHYQALQTAANKLIHQVTSSHLTSSLIEMFLLQEKAQEDVSKHLVSITGLLVGADTDQQSDIVLAQLSQEMYNSGLLLLLLKNMHRIDFEVVIEQVL